MVGGELLALWQKYGTLPQQLVKIYVAELALVLGNFFLVPLLMSAEINFVFHAQIFCIMLV
jgi:hypothetical protein